MTKNQMKKRKFQKNNEGSEIYRIDSLNDFIVDDDEGEGEYVGEEYEGKKREKNEYFEVDSFPLQKELTVVLSKELQVEQEKIKNIISETFSKYNYSLDDYFGIKPSNNNWKIGADQKTVKKIEPELLSIRKEMENEVPTIPKIMTSNITKNDKKTCLRLFDQFNNCTAYSEEYFRLMDEINLILLKGKNYSKNEIDFLDSEEEKLRKLYINLGTLKDKILKLEAEPEIKAKLLSQYEQMMSYPSDSSTHTSLKEEIEWSIKLPYKKREIDPYINMNNIQLNEFYCQVRKKLDDELFSMENVKNRIIHILNDRKTSEDESGRNIALVGNPGVGKTAIGKVLGKILDKKFAKISAATLDSAAIKGSNKVYVGSEPSMILQILAELKTNNPIIMIDEFDKVDIKCQHALLHISDTSDNKEFQDNYLKNNIHDISKVMFIFNLNSVDNLHPALLDRLDIIYVKDYINEEKIQIFKNYMLPKALNKVGLKKNDLIIPNNLIEKFFENRKDITLRNVEKTIKELVGKINMYRNVILPNGTTGNLKLPYEIPNFKLPLKVDEKLFNNLIS